MVKGDNVDRKSCYRPTQSAGDCPYTLYAVTPPPSTPFFWEVLSDMKEITKTSRLCGSLEKLFRMLNQDFFGNELEEPVITVQSTPKAYGHYSVAPIWSVKGETLKHEINIGAGTLDRPIECTCATLLHEMVHMYNGTVLHAQDTSRQGQYHNKQFRETAEAHGLICHKTDKYGWSDTSSEISDKLIEWIIDNNISEIKINRNEGYSIRVAGGKTAAQTRATPVDKPKGNSRRYHCPKCGTIIRATRAVNVGCWDCMVQMVEG